MAMVRAHASSFRYYYPSAAQNSEFSPNDFYIQCGTRRYGRVLEQPLARFVDATFGGLEEEPPKLPTRFYTAICIFE